MLCRVLADAFLRKPAGFFQKNGIEDFVFATLAFAFGRESCCDAARADVGTRIWEPEFATRS
jgi:hypothetical protein